MEKTKRRSLALILAMAMLLAMIPALAAAPSNAGARIPSGASADFDEPVAGSHPDFSPSKPEGDPEEDPYELSMKWYVKNGSDWTEITESDTFEAGKTYKAEVYAALPYPYAFAEPGTDPDYTYKINGQEVVPAFVEDHDDFVETIVMSKEYTLAAEKQDYTIEVPVRINVKQGGRAPAPARTFTIGGLGTPSASDPVDVAVKTNGAGAYAGGNMVLAIRGENAETLRRFGQVIFVAAEKDEDGGNWDISDDFYLIWARYDQGSDAASYDLYRFSLKDFQADPNKDEDAFGEELFKYVQAIYEDGDTTFLQSSKTMTFTNTYTADAAAKPKSPKTGDSGAAPWAAALALAGAASVILAKKRGESAR